MPDDGRIGGRHIHLDPLGGIAGDMMLAALLDARPDLVKPASEFAATIRPGLALHLVETKDKGLRGRRVSFDLPDKTRGPRGYGDYCELFRDVAPDGRMADRALDILRRLAEAEARVHGVPVEKVHFHEISDWDSVADILLTAFALDRMGIGSASTGPVPMGAGRIETEHGTMPVPAPATLELLRVVEVIDDGRIGERVTPTGAAILAHLRPSRMPSGARLATAGYGLGSRSLEGMANALRVSLWDVVASDPDRDRVVVIAFHVDDQTPEDLAVALERLRAREDVLDVLQLTALRKKGRTVARLEVICREDCADAVAEACFGETTTIGLRMHVEQRLLLPRSESVVDVHGSKVRVKCSHRPDGTVIEKPENDDIRNAGDRDSRNRLRQDAARMLKDPRTR